MTPGEKLISKPLIADTVVFKVEDITRSLTAERKNCYIQILGNFIMIAENEQCERFELINTNEVVRIIGARPIQNKEYVYKYR